MIVLAGAAIGIAIGVFRARKQGGSALDMAQYGAVHGIVLGLAALFATIILARMAG